jgi:hypothetical protein
MNEDVRAADLFLQDRDGLREGMPARVLGRGAPEELDQVVASEGLAGLNGEADEESEMLARTKTHDLARGGEEGGDTQRPQREQRRHAEPESMTA